MPESHVNDQQIHGLQPIRLSRHCRMFSAGRLDRSRIIHAASEHVRNCEAQADTGLHPVWGSIDPNRIPKLEFGQTLSENVGMKGFYRAFQF